MKHLLWLCYLLWVTSVSAAWTSGDQVTSGHCSPAIKDVQGNVNVTITPPAEKHALSASNVEIIDSNLDRQDSPYEQKQKDGIKRITPKTEILQVEQVCTSGEQHNEYNYDFPTIDFKFQNTGNATAFLKQFTINVIQAEIDTTPVLKFTADAIDGALQIAVSNRGWGTVECQLQLHEPTLERLFPTHLQKSVVLESSDEQQVFHLTLDMADKEQFELIKQKFTSFDEMTEGEKYKKYKTILLRKLLRKLLKQKHEEELGKIIFSGLPLEAFQVSYRCSDRKNLEYLNEQKLDSWGRDFLLTANEFIVLQPPVFCSAKESDITYTSVINLMQQEPQELVYPISRKISQGDVERFHIMIGSSMSVKLRLRFKFSIDKDKSVESEEFEIYVWNPKSSRWANRYRDGDGLRRDLDDNKHLLAKQLDDENKRFLAKQLDDAKRLLVEQQEENKQCLTKQQEEKQPAECSKWRLEGLKTKVDYLQYRVDNYPFSNPILGTR